jgi:hypothetical protein
MFCHIGLQATAAEMSYDLPKLPKDVPLEVRARMWYIHDGASGHFSRAVRDVLSIVTDGHVEEDPPHGLQARHQIRILWISTFLRKILVYVAPVDN